ncbi:MAG: hypothetical protein ACJ8GJ_01125, partial [Vitreoscilla sp.]
ISPFFLPDGEDAEPARSAAFVMGYASLSEDRIREGVRRLAAALLPLLKQANPRSLTRARGM